MNEEMFSHYKLDIKEIDDQHWELILIMNEIKQLKCDLCYTGVCERCSTLLQKLQTTLQHHFACEEQIMEQSNYPYLNYHKENHIDTMKLCSNKLNTKLGTGYRDYLMNSLKQVLIDHIDHHDMQYGNWVKQQNQTPT